MAKVDNSQLINELAKHFERYFVSVAHDFTERIHRKDAFDYLIGGERDNDIYELYRLLNATEQKAVMVKTFDGYANKQGYIVLF